MGVVWIRSLEMRILQPISLYDVKVENWFVIVDILLEQVMAVLDLAEESLHPVLRCEIRCSFARHGVLVALGASRAVHKLLLRLYCNENTCRCEVLPEHNALALKLL